MKPNEKTMDEFVNFFGKNKFRYVQLFSKDPAKSEINRCIPGKWDSGLKELVLKANTTGKMEVGTTVNSMKKGGRQRKNVTQIDVLFADFDDGKTSVEDMLAFAITPHMITQTSPKNGHAYWRVEGCDVDQFSRVQKALAAKLGSDEQVSDPNRAMRIGGSLNLKGTKPFQTKIPHIMPDAKPIPINEFIKTMGLVIKGAAKKKKSSIVAKKTSAKKLMTLAMRMKIQTALRHLPADDRSVWLKTGQAIHDVDATERGYALWKKWSKKSHKFDEQMQQQTWQGFQAGRGISIRTLFWLASRYQQGSFSAFDEISLAELFARWAKKMLRFLPDTKEWVHYDGVAWKPDAQAPHRLMLAFIKSHSNGNKGELFGSVKRYRSMAGMRAIVSQAELLKPIHISPQAFDQKPELLAVKNGVIDLKAGTFRKAKPEDFLRRKANVEFDDSAKCPLWQQFVRSIACDDRELYEYIRRALGYTLYGEANQQVFFLAIGSGGNGKGTLTRTIQKLLGDYAISVAPNLLTSAYAGNANGPTPALAKLNGARMVICSELPTGRRLDEAFVKQYAGGDEITARQTYGEVFSFTPEGKLWLSANEPPEIRMTDEAMWRRIKPIPFNATFQGKQRDNELEKKLVDEYPGILNWLMKGAKKFAKEGFGSCKAAEALEATMRRNADSVETWLSERCNKSKSAMTQSSVAYDDYCTFMKQMRSKYLTHPAFRATLDEKGFHPRRRSSNNVYVGFALRNK